MDEKKTPYAPNNLTERPLSHYMALFAEADPEEISKRTGVPYEEGSFTLRIAGKTYRIGWPDFPEDEPKAKERILCLRYLLDGKNVPQDGRFLAYRDLPWGDVYEKSFNGRCIRRMIGMFGTRPDEFTKKCEAFGGIRVPGSGLSYQIPFLNGLDVRLILWEGDEEFPPSGQILFSSNFSEAFSAEDRVVALETLLGNMK